MWYGSLCRTNTETNIVDTGLKFRGHKILLAPRGQHKADRCAECLMIEFIERHFPTFFIFNNVPEFRDYDPHQES